MNGGVTTSSLCSIFLRSLSRGRVTSSAMLQSKLVTEVERCYGVAMVMMVSRRFTCTSSSASISDGSRGSRANNLLVRPRLNPTGVTMRTRSQLRCLSMIMSVSAGENRASKEDRLNGRRSHSTLWKPDSLGLMFWTRIRH